MNILFSLGLCLTVIVITAGSIFGLNDHLATALEALNALQGAE